MKRKTKLVKSGKRKIKPKFNGTLLEKIEHKIQNPESIIFSDRGIPILELREKVAALESCLLSDSKEDSLGHLFDLISFVAPRYKFLKFRGIKALKDWYGKNPTPIYVKQYYEI